jgi:hypothetical protein
MRQGLEEACANFQGSSRGAAQGVLISSGTTCDNSHEMLSSRELFRAIEPRGSVGNDHIGNLYLACTKIPKVPEEEKSCCLYKH